MTVREVTPSEAHAMVKNGALVIDVREPDEHDEARIPGARLVPLGELVDRADELPRDRLLLMQCRSGARSRSAAEALLALGFVSVANLRGGIIGWANAGLPVEG